jgi:phosphate transport system ATP-binding protein
MNNWILCTSNLNVRYDSTFILKNINIRIPGNKVTVILGPSGCGKTTFLKCVNRLVDLYNGLHCEGSITLKNQEIFQSRNNLTAIRQKMGLLSQKPYPLPMSIFDNVAYGLKIQGMRKKSMVSQKVEFHLKQVGLWEEVKDRLHSPAVSLSIGQQQRLCLARGLAVGPEIILADEPTSALDPISSACIEEQFKILKEEYTIILVTHILRQAKRLADYVIFMYLGEVIEQGIPNDVFNHPVHPLTQRYLQSGY